MSTKYGVNGHATNGMSQPEERANGDTNGHMNGHGNAPTQAPPASEAALRVCAEQALRVGRIPMGAPAQTWGGPGTGERCAVCEELVTPEQSEIELEFSAETLLTGPVHLHVRCFAAWEFERGHMAAKSIDGAAFGGLNSASGDGSIRVREHPSTNQSLGE